MQYSEAKQSLAYRLDIDYTNIASNDLFSDAELGDWIQAALKKAWDYKPWIFTQDNWKTVTTSDGYNDYPGDCEDESIDRMYINSHSCPN